MSNNEVVHAPEIDLIVLRNASTFLCKCHFPKTKEFALRLNNGWDLRRKVSLKSQQFYYEVRLNRVVDAVGVGVAEKSFPLVDRIPGWEPTSVGIHSDDGQNFICGVGHPGWVEPWNKEGVTVGIGIVPNTGKLFFTKNGEFVRQLCEFNVETCPILYPVVGISDKKGLGSEVSLVTEPPFLFNFAQLPQDQLSKKEGVGAVSWGQGSRGKLGLAGKQFQAVPIEIPSFRGKRLESISCGNDSSIALSEFGEVFVFGSNYFNQLGISEGESAIPKQLDLAEVRPIEVSAGYRHSLILLDNGTIIVNGNHTNAGVVHNQTMESPGTKFTHIAAGYFRSAALTENGDLYCWGEWNNAPSSELKLIKGVPKFTSLSIGGRVGYALSKDGVIYSWSDGYRPNPISSDKRFVSISSSWYHFAAIEKEKGDIYQWSYGQLETTRTLPDRINEPRLHVVKADYSRFLRIAAGWRFLIALKGDGKIYTIGNGQYIGQPIQLDSLYFPTTIYGLDNFFFENVFAGETHAFATFREITSPWNLLPSLYDEDRWEVIGYGSNPPKRMELVAPTLLRTASGDEYTSLMKLWNDALHGSKYQIEKAYAIDNPMLESSFQSEISKLDHKWKETPHLFRKEDWKNGKHMERRTNTKLHYDEICKNHPWNKERQIPVIPVCHGTNEASVWNICKSGFSSLARLNEGWYGRGMYFTTHVPYAASYTERIDKVDKEHHEEEKEPKEEESKEEEKKEEKEKKEKIVKPQIFIIGYVVPGSVYPVVEHPHKAGNLKGKPNHTGYQSHYIRVNKKGLPTQKQTAYDELVIFQESQILPRYVVYATPKKENNSFVEPIKIPPQINKENFEEMYVQCTELGAQYIGHINYLDKRTFNSLLNEVKVWREKNQEETNVLNIWKKLSRAIQILNNTAKKLHEEEEKKRQLLKEKENEKEEQESDDSEGDGESSLDSAAPITYTKLDYVSLAAGNEALLAELIRLSSENQSLQEQNALLKRKVEWLNVMAVQSKRRPHK